MFSVQDLAKIFAVHPEKIRVWAKGDQLKVAKRGPAGARLFDPQEVARFAEAHELGRLSCRACHRTLDIEEVGTRHFNKGHCRCGGSARYDRRM